MSHNPDDPKSLTIAYEACTEIDLEEIAAERGFKTADIMNVVVRWNTLTIELKDGQSVMTEFCSSDDIDYKYPAYLAAYDAEGATIVADNNDCLRLDESTGESLCANKTLLRMVEAYLTLHPSTRFTISDGFLYDGKDKVILTAYNAVTYMEMIALN